MGSPKLYTGGVPLLVGGVPAIDAACCCGAPATACNGAVALAGCFEDLYASYPNNPGDNAAFLAALAAQDIDFDVAGTFGNPCDGGSPTCDIFAGGPITLVNPGGGATWQFSTSCTNTYNISLAYDLSISCGGLAGAGNCMWDLTGTISRASGSPFWSRGLGWREIFSEQQNFSTLNRPIPWLGQTTTGSAGCLYSGHDGTIALH